jgi:hypothetical protein
MDKDAVKNLMFGGICELVRDRRYYYHSSVGADYCHFTEEGDKAVKAFVTQMAVNIHKAEEADLDRRAKQMVIKGLKGESV